jgi:hypothetical protein
MRLCFKLTQQVGFNNYIIFINYDSGDVSNFLAKETNNTQSLSNSQNY